MYYRYQDGYLETSNTKHDDTWIKTDKQFVIGHDGRLYFKDEYKIDTAKLHDINKRINELEAWLNEHDYIGIKIATGRATPDDYKEEIELMKIYAAELDELRKEKEQYV